MALDGLFTQLIDGFCYIEEHSIIHTDIWEGNILFDRTGKAKIFNFGIGITRINTNEYYFQVFYIPLQKRNPNFHSSYMYIDIMVNNKDFAQKS